MDEVEAPVTIGRYGTDECVATSDLGALFRGYDPILCRPVAIKILRSELSKDGDGEGLHETFKRRARAACGLVHPNVPTTFDFGETNGISFIVMEDFDGSPLDRLLKVSGPFAPQRAVAILLQLLDALKYSHENRVLHLDLKPSMVFVLKTDQIKIADFGVALVNASEPASIGELRPKMPSMAPEQLMGAPVDHRTDLFAAGALLFEMLTCAKPFRGRTVAELVRQMEIGVPEDVCALNAAVPSTLRSVIETALAYRPAQRFATADAFSDAVCRAVSLGRGREIGTRSPPFRAPVSGRATPADENQWDSEILGSLEAHLAAHIGPVAAIAVKRAAKRVDDLNSLYEELSVHIRNEKEREEFLAGAPRPIAATSRRIAGLHADNGAAVPVMQRSEPSDLPDPAVLDIIETELLQHIGPIARVLIAQRLRRFQGLSDLCRSLADRIADETERAAFLNFGERLGQAVLPERNTDVWGRR